MPAFKLRKADRQKIVEAAKRAEGPAAALTAAVELTTKSLAHFACLSEASRLVGKPIGISVRSVGRKVPLGRPSPMPSQRGPLLGTSLKIFRLIFRQS